MSSHGGAAGTLKGHIVRILKFALALGIVAYLVIDARRHQSFARLVHEPKHWGMLASGCLACFVGVLLTIMRWYYLVRALGVAFSVGDAMRLGFLGYLLNFVAPGSVGGDLFKAVFLARERPKSRPEAVASVVMDRLIGLYILFVIAAGAMLYDGQLSSPLGEMRLIAGTTVSVTAALTALMIVLLGPDLSGGRVTAAIGRIPRVGRVLRKLIDAVRMYRTRPSAMLVATVLSFLSHGLFILCVYWLALGLPGGAPPLSAHLIIVPLAMLTGALPITPNGLGTFELAMEFLYSHAPLSVPVPEGQGTLVALVYRLTTIAIAAIGVVFYFANRRQVVEALHEAEEEQAAGA